jgi:hypothetical protein
MLTRSHQQLETIKKTFQEMLKPIGDSQSNCASCNDEEDGEDEVFEEDPHLGKLSEHGEPG